MEVALLRQLTLVELFATTDVNKVSSAGQSHPAVLVDAPRSFVHQHALLALQKLGLAILFVTEVAKEVVRVEVVFLHAEGTRNFSFVVKFRLLEHLVAV